MNFVLIVPIVMIAGLTVQSYRRCLYHWTNTQELDYVELVRYASYVLFICYLASVIEAAAIGDITSALLSLIVYFSFVSFVAGIFAVGTKLTIPMSGKARRPIHPQYVLFASTLLLAGWCLYRLVYNAFIAGDFARVNLMLVDFVGVFVAVFLLNKVRWQIARHMTADQVS